MEIPNYDSDTKNKKIKQPLPFMPKDTFRMLICGNSGSRKTNLLYHMLIEPLLYFNEIHLYAKNLDQEKCQNLMDKMNEMSRKVGYDIMTVSNDKIIPMGDMDYEDNQKLVIFDNYVCEKNQRQIVDYFIQGRHKNCSVIYCDDCIPGPETETLAQIRQTHIKRPCCLFTEQRQPSREGVVTSLTKLSLWGCCRASATIFKSKFLQNTKRYKIELFSLLYL